MRSIFRASLVAGVLLVTVSDGLAQAASSGPQKAGAAGDGSGGASTTSPVAATDTRTERQKTLALQVEQLFAMATELKTQVDKTNRNILSLKVVEKAEQIELMAKGMKGAVKR